MNKRQYMKLFKEYCRSKGETEQTIHSHWVIDFNRETRWTGMEINFITRKVEEHPSGVIKVMVLGKEDGGAYFAVLNLMCQFTYIQDLNGEFVESIPLEIQDGVVRGRSQDYLL